MVWDELKVFLTELRDQRPGMLVQYPDLSVDDGRWPPFQIQLAATAIAAAEELHQQFGNAVELTVGMLPYPPASQPQRLSEAPKPAEQLDPREVAVELDGSASIPTGQTRRHGLLVTNLARDELQILTNGQLTAMIVDPGTGEIVGGFTGAQALPLVVCRVLPGETERIPLLIGTASSRPQFGYAVPAGSWGLQATLKLGTPRHPVLLRTPVLPLTITDNSVNVAVAYRESARAVVADWRRCRMVKPDCVTAIERT